MKDNLTEEAEEWVASDDYLQETLPVSWYLVRLLKIIIRLLLDIRDKLDAQQIKS